MSGQPDVVRRVARRLARVAGTVRGDLPLAVGDCLAIVGSYTLLLESRFDFAVPETFWSRFKLFLPMACVAHVTATWLWGGYGRTWRHASIDEARRVLLGGLTAAAALFAGFGWGAYRMPFTVLFSGPVLVIFLFGGERFMSRLLTHNGHAPTGLRVLVVGAGATGAAALREMQRNSQLGLVPVVVVDDDRSLRWRTLHNVPIVGDIGHLGDVIAEHDVHQVLYAIPSGGPRVAERVAEAAAAAGIPVRVLPAPSDWVHGVLSLRDARDLRIEDLLLREQVEIDLAPVHALLQGRRVLVTGGGGWIGAEIARQVAEFGPAVLVLLDHDETHLYDAVDGLPCRVESVLADIRDASVLDDVFARVRPEVVFHAAAHKHVPILERHACEAVRTNVFGTKNVVDACTRVGTSHLVCISTDKAAQPNNVMAASKWAAEQVVLAYSSPDAAFCSVRFGNVLGSRGSVIPTFQRQIAAGGPVTVTDRRMTRYFMSTDEAVRLVLLAAARSRRRDVLALEMGEQVNIFELARRMIRLCGYELDRDIEINVTGARPGENLREAVVGTAERRRRDEAGPIITIEPVPLPRATLTGALERLDALAVAGDHEQARTTLLGLAAVAFAQPEVGSSVASL